MARNEPIYYGETRIASGAASLQVPSYVTINTGKYSPDPLKVQVILRRGNTITEIGLYPWVKMHGVKADYHKHGSYKRTTIYDDNSVTFQATGAWSVSVETPRARLPGRGSYW
jgi:hypothetical protein